MRILQIELRAYGPFTEKHLDLSSGNHGLHVIYGANEAGKSSSLRAISDLLFGIPQRTPDNFIHPYPKLRLAANLRHSDGSTLRFVRRKTPKNSLFDEQDSKPIDDLNLARFLGNVDREMFHFMFGIDHHRLREGGEKIVKGDGQIGELLFSAGAGISDLRSAQKQLNDELEVLLKPSGRSGAIIEEIRDYKANRDTVKQTVVTAETWNQHQERLRLAEQRKDALDEKIRLSAAEKNRLVRIRTANSAILQWEKTTKELAAIADCPRLPDDFEQQYQRLLLELRGLQQQKANAQTTLKNLSEELEGIVIPENILHEADAIEALRERLGGYRVALAERPKLETQLEATEKEVKEILRELGRTPDLATIEELRIPREKRIRIQDLGNQKEAILERFKSSQKACEKLRTAISQCESELEQLQTLPDTRALKQAIEHIQSGGDWETQRTSLQNEITELQESANIKLLQLGLYQGSLDEFEKAAFPSLATIECFSDELKDNSAELRNILSRQKEKQREHQQLCDSLAELELHQRVLNEEDLLQARQRRDSDWQEVLASLGIPPNTDLDSRQSNDSKQSNVQNRVDPALFKAFQKRIEEADLVADQLRMDADRVARKMKLVFDRSLCEAAIEKLAQESLATEQKREEISQRWSALWKELPVSPLSPSEMRDWHHRQEQLREHVCLLRQKSAEERLLSTRIDDTAADLRSILRQTSKESLDPQASLKQLIDSGLAQLEVSRQSQQRRENLIEKCNSLRDELTDTQSQSKEAENDFEQWKSDWASEMQSLGLSIEAMPSQANSVLQEITHLFEKFRECDQVRIQLEGKSRESSDFAEDARQLMSRTLPKHEFSTPENAATLLSSELKKAIASEENRVQITKQIALQKVALEESEKGLTNAHNALDEMCRQAACEAYEDLDEAAKKSRDRNTLEQRVAELEQFIDEHRGGVDFETFLREVEQERANFDSIEPRIADIEREIKTLNEERDSILGTIREETIELEKIDGRSQASELNLKCEGIAAKLEERVQEIAGLRMATAILHAAIEAYREKNQGPVLSRASQIFKQITNENYTRLQADFDEQGLPVLTGVRAETEEKVLVSTMSDGTCDQLYLALRLATLENWLDHHEPLPLIVDDILLNFDDERSAATLQSLAHLSEKTQVLFFTHHQHLIDLAQQTLPKDQLYITNL